IHSLWYPAGMSEKRTEYRRCTLQRLFLDQLLPNVDAVLYLDTDVIFLRPPDALWDEFKRFNSDQLLAGAMPTYASWMEKKFRHGQGFNCGILLFNLTRGRHFPGGLTKAFESIYTEEQLPGNDQLILNYFANQHPELFYELDCEWNFRMEFCSKVESCPGSRPNGAYIVHGNSEFFMKPNVPMLKGFFDVWSKFNVSEPLSKLIFDLEKTLSKPTKHACSPANGIDKVLLNQLYRQLN
ncbi:Glycosyl transferase family 8, partial [Trinorchestia longiramus]